MDSYTSLKDNSWRCMGCGRALGFKDELAIVVKTGNGQTVMFIPEVVIGQCKCGLVTVLKDNCTTFYVNNDITHHRK